MPSTADELKIHAVLSLKGLDDLVQVAVTVCREGVDAAQGGAIKQPHGVVQDECEVSLPLREQNRFKRRRRFVLGAAANDLEVMMSAFVNFRSCVSLLGFHASRRPLGLARPDVRHGLQAKTSAVQLPIAANLPLTECCRQVPRCGCGFA